VLNGVGRFYLQTGEFVRAERYLSKAHKLADKKPGPLHNLGLVYLKRGEYSRAIDYFKNALRYYSEKNVRGLSQLHSDYGLALYRTRSYKEALKQFQKALKLNNYNASAHFNLGLLFEKTGNYERALDHYEFAFNIDDQYVNAYNNYGLLLMNVRENYEEALKYFERAIDVDSGYVFAYYNRGIALINLERYAEARQSLQRVIEVVSPEKKLYKRARDLLDELEG